MGEYKREKMQEAWTKIKLDETMEEEGEAYASQHICLDLRKGEG